MKCLLLVFLFSVFCNSQELYSFIENYEKGATVKYKEDSIWSFEVAGNLTENGMTNTKTIKCLGFKDNFLLLEETMVDLVATKKTLGKMSADHTTNQLIGVPYTLYVDTLLGTIDHIETEFKEFEELINAQVRSVGNMDNRIFPFGKNAVDIKIKDSWTMPSDSVEFFMGDGGSPNYMVFTAKFTLDKVKNKKGVNIAYISAIYEITANLFFIQDSKIFEGNIIGEIKNKIRFDLTNNNMILSKSTGSMKWKFVLEGERFTAMMDLSNKKKRVK